MRIDVHVLGDFQANCYCVRENETARRCLLIDPGANPEPLIRFLESGSLLPAAIVLTHGHVDHIGGVETVRQRWPNVKVVIHEADAFMLTNPSANLSILADTLVQTRPAEITLGPQNQFFSEAGLRFQILYTPGHTQGGICLYSAKDAVLFAGDTLFAGSVGRTDLPGGDYEQLLSGIRDKLLILPEQTKVYPGHGPATTIRNEKKHNPFVRV
ncbi:MAG: MBL fold metallo-hydrolase [Planctomycetaceae bacterium]|nr:MBL fold metallo-hydrolase [Planctomycetaceae bacterium]